MTLQPDKSHFDDEASTGAAFVAAIENRGSVAAQLHSDGFTAHVFACVLAIGLHESRANRSSVGAAIGLGREDLSALIGAWRPPAAKYIEIDLQPETVSLDEEELQLQSLFHSFRANDSREGAWLAAILARRCMSPNHLWQDLGLGSRKELGQLIGERFPRLAARNLNNMKWKKFFYRALCEIEGFTLCAAPTCRECNDFHECFGDESGESRLAHSALAGPAAFARN